MGETTRHPAADTFARCCLRNPAEKARCSGRRAIRYVSPVRPFLSSRMLNMYGMSMLSRFLFVDKPQKMNII